MPNHQLKELIAHFAARDAEVAGYAELDFLIVDARDSLIDDDDVSMLVEHKNLVDLNLEATKITNASMRYIVNFPRLEYLNIGRTRCDERCLESIKTLSQLEGLGLSGIRLPTQFDILLHLPNLDVLELADTQVSKEEVRRLLQSTNVTVLDISGNGFLPGDFLDLHELTEDNRLVMLEFDNGVREGISRPPVVRH